jgi:hypothetical protein
MSLFSGLANIGRSVAGFFNSNSLGATLARTAATALALRAVTNSINRQNQPTDRPDPGVRLQLNPNVNNRIPVVYGKTILGGNVIDAYMSNDKSKMWFVLVLSEKTGVKINNNPSQIFFRRIFLDGLELKLKNDGITADRLVDVDGNSDNSVDGLIKVYCYSGNSASPVVPIGFSNANLQDARSVIPDWDNTKEMNELVFVILEITYNREKRVTGLGEFRFELENTISLPGDALFDYMTNTRYGAAIPPGDILVQ